MALMLTQPKIYTSKVWLYAASYFNKYACKKNNNYDSFSNIPWDITSDYLLNNILI